MADAPRVTKVIKKTKEIRKKIEDDLDEMPDLKRPNDILSANKVAGWSLHFFPTTGTLWDSCYGINYPYAVCPWVPTIMVTFYPSVRHGFLEKGCRLFKVLLGNTAHFHSQY